jgi:hypothetical protein
MRFNVWWVLYNYALHRTNKTKKREKARAAQQAWTWTRRRRRGVILRRLCSVVADMSCDRRFMHFSHGAPQFNGRTCRTVALSLTLAVLPAIAL